MTPKFATRQTILDFAEQTYNTTPEYLWRSYPNYAVLRHPNKKWFGVVMDIQKEKLNLKGTEKIDILVIQCAPEVKSSLLGTTGILPAYHMNKEKWITVLLDGSVDSQLAFTLLDMSYEITENKRKQKIF